MEKLIKCIDVYKTPSLITLALRLKKTRNYGKINKKNLEIFLDSKRLLLFNRKI